MFIRSIIYLCCLSNLQDWGVEFWTPWVTLALEKRKKIIRTAVSDL
jgi:hypothetical protein